MNPLASRGRARGRHEAEDSAPRMTDSHVERSESQPPLQPTQGRSLQAGGVFDSWIGEAGGLWNISLLFIFHFLKV